MATDDYYQGNQRRKGNSILAEPDSYIVLDIETTGLSPYSDEIIEIGALKVENNVIISTFSSLIRPNNEISDFITALTGISNQMLTTAPRPKEVLYNFLDFTGDAVLVAHNAHFDVNFVYDSVLMHFNVHFSNNFVDTLRLFKYFIPRLPSYKLSHLAHRYRIKPEEGFHRAIGDCKVTHVLFQKLKNNELPIDIKPEYLDCRHRNIKIKPEDMQTSNTEFDTSNPVYDKVCVFTGTLANMCREVAMQRVVDLGGRCDDDITKKTNVLVLADAVYNTKDGKSNKRKKAETYALKGCDIEIIPEHVFYEWIGIDKS